VKRDEVWRARFGPTVRGEIQKARPAVIVSNDSSNRALNRVQVVPITSNASRVHPCEARIYLNGEERKAAADQIATVSKGRLTTSLGSISDEDITLIEQAIRVQLGIP
jgi:mRNA interferase MazF